MLQNLTDLISNSSMITRLEASTPESVQVASTFKRREYPPLTVPHALKITCLAVHSVEVHRIIIDPNEYKELLEAMIQCVYESVGITSFSGTTGQTCDSTIVVRLARVVRRSSRPQELDTIAVLAKYCLDYLRRKADPKLYVLHPALDLSH